MLFNSNVILFALTFALGLLYHGSEAQDLARQPNCGQNCLLTAFTTLSNGCTQTDFACLCKSQKFTGTSNLRYSSSCTSTEAATTKSWGAKTCASVGVNVTATLGNTTSVGAGGLVPPLLEQADSDVVNVDEQVEHELAKISDSLQSNGFTSEE
ncbi:hypothetical protein BY996DRAFT_6408160 [Phakopsora pachyrhizi]|nr:hypothetical protein BY996DRAFT_6408160 [Phakopsora pachyrhizi]